MRNIKCSDCAEYQNEWCEKIIDSPHPDIFRDCQYWQKRKDMVEVVRCKDCKYKNLSDICEYFDVNAGNYTLWHHVEDNDFCSKAERRSDETD